MIWTSETWLRDLKEQNDRAIRALPIIGEQLHVVGADASGATEVVRWNISRPNGEGAPVLTPLMPEDDRHPPGRMFFIEPVIAAMKMVLANSER